VSQIYPNSQLHRIHYFAELSWKFEPQTTERCSMFKCICTHTHMGSRECAVCAHLGGRVEFAYCPAVATQNSSGFVLLCVCAALCIMIIMKRSIICIPCRKFNSLMPLNPRRAGHNAAVMGRVVDYFACMPNSFIHVWLPRCGNRDAAVRARYLRSAVIALPISPVSFQTGPVVSTIGQLTWHIHPLLPPKVQARISHFARSLPCVRNGRSEMRGSRTERDLL
jgi:hypothetical protein